MSETVHVKVIKGSVSAQFLNDKYELGDEFETTRENAVRLDPSFIQILEDLPVEEPTITATEVEAPQTKTEIAMGISQLTEEEQQKIKEEPEELEATVTVEEVAEEPPPPKKKKSKKASANAS